MKRYLLAAAALATIPHAATAADLIKTPAAAARQPQRLSEAPIYQNPVYNGRVAVMDGRTLWYPQYAQRVRLVEIDACELPQWAIDPKWVDRERQKAPSPVPCGPLAKAWLKRTIGSKPVECTVLAYGNDGIDAGRFKGDPWLKSASDFLAKLKPCLRREASMPCGRSPAGCV
ncbi:hypothetical protein D9M69_521830 [compost metagenome]